MRSPKLMPVLRRIDASNWSLSVSLFELGKLLSSKKMFYEAYQSLDKAIKIDAKFANAHYELAVLLMNKSAQKVISRKVSSSHKKKAKK